jgi:hypothetical protein
LALLLSPSMGEGLGGGDLVKIFGDHPMRARQ